MKKRIGIGFIGLIGLICHWPLALPAQVGPYVYNSSVPITPSVTAYAAFAEAATTANNGLPPFQTGWMTNANWSEWWSADLGVATNMQVITSITGRYGNILSGNCLYTSQTPGNGRPGWFFDNSGNMAMTNGLLGIDFTNTGTFLCVWTFPQSSYDGGNHIAVTTTLVANTCDWELWALDPAGANSGYAIGWHYPGNSQTIEEATAWGTHVGLLTWTPTNSMWFIDGKAIETIPNGNAQAQGNGGPWSYGFSGMLTLGSDQGFAPFNGYIHEVMVSSNQVSAATADQINYYFLNKYGLLYHDSYDFVGDSLPQCAYANWNGSLEYLIASNYPGEQVLNLGSGAATTGMCLTNAQIGITTSTYGGRTCWFLWNAFVNDSGLGLAVITNQQIAIAKMARTNGITPILVIPPSSQIADQTLYNGQTLSIGARNVWSNSWPTYFAAVVNGALDPYVGPTNSFTNTLFYANNQHLNTAGYAELYPYFQAALNYALNPKDTVFTGTTNQPPPWIGPNFSVTEGGHMWASLGNNFWTLIK
jgi:hypothetical protein